MKRNYLVSMMVCLGMMTILNGQTQALKIGGNDAPPYRILQGERPAGIYIDIMSAVAKRLGLAVDFEEMPNARALGNMQSGAIDIMLGPNKTPERELFMTFLVEVPFPREDKGVYIQQGKPDIGSYEGLRGRTIGIIKGMAYNPQFDADSSLSKVEIPDYATGLRMLEAGRLDAVIIPERQADYLFASTKKPAAKASLSFPGNPSFIAVSKASPKALALIPQIVAAMKALKSDGTIDSIIKKYQ